MQRANSQKKKRLKFWAAVPRGPFPMPPRTHHTLLQQPRLPPIQLQIYSKLPIDTLNNNSRSANPLAPETQTTTPLAAPPPLLQLLWETTSRC